MLEPLTQWYCDKCGEIIKKPEDGYVTWKIDKESKEYDFNIIHKVKCDHNDFHKSGEVKNFLGIEGIVYLTSFLSNGIIQKNLGRKDTTHIKDLDEFIDFFRRFQVPYYEEARKKFGKYDLLERMSDANEIYPYSPDVLKSIILTKYENT